MAGHVFHPGHEQLHGVTVVVDGASGKTYVGRWHERTEKGTLLHDVAVHEPAPGAAPEGAGADRTEFLKRTVKFGVKVAHRHLVLPDGEITAVRPLGELGL